jgi:ribonuclease-3
MALSAPTACISEAQKHASVTPTYEIIDENGPDHDKVFTVGVFLDNQQIATGTGKSKQEAESVAAEVALEEKGWE